VDIQEFFLRVGHPTLRTLAKNISTPDEINLPGFEGDGGLKRVNVFNKKDGGTKITIASTVIFWGGMDVSVNLMFIDEKLPNLATLFPKKCSEREFRTSV